LRVASDGVDEIRPRSVPKRLRLGEGLLQCPAMGWDERMKDLHAAARHLIDVVRFLV